MPRRTLTSLLFPLGLGACLDPGEGMRPRVAWQVVGDVWAQPVVWDTLVVAAFTDGRISAFVRETGAVRWNIKLQGPFLGEGLLLAGERLIVPEFSLHAVNVRTGALLWTYEGLDGRTGISNPALSGDTVFVADYGGGAAALDVATGIPHWSVEFGEAAFTPALSPSLVLLGTRGFLGGPGVGPLGAGHLIALDRATGAERWRAPLPDSAGFPGSGGANNSGVVAEGFAIVGTRSGRIVAFDLEDGSIAWERTTGDPLLALYSGAPIVFGGAIAIRRSDALLESFSPVNGGNNWELQAGGVGGHQMTLCGAHLCIGDGRFTVVSAAGQVFWAHGGGSTGVAYLAAPAIDLDGRAFIGGVLGVAQGRFMALDLPVSVGPTP